MSTASLFAPQVRRQSLGHRRERQVRHLLWEGNRAGDMVRGRWPFPPVMSSLWDPQNLPGIEQYPSTFSKV